MRTIMFRGHDGYAWQFGALSVSAFRCDIIKPPYLYRVDPKSVGQFTGLKDKNGKDIYEGDIVKIHFTDDCDSKNYDEFDYYTAVVYDEKLGAFVESECLDTLISEECINGEVVGNMYGNPELLKLNE